MHSSDIQMVSHTHTDTQQQKCLHRPSQAIKKEKNIYRKSADVTKSSTSLVKSEVSYRF